MKTIINSFIHEFDLPAYHDGNFTTVSRENLMGHWSILFFYLNDFCFICPTELADMADNYGEFQKLGVEVYGISADSHYAHKAWHESSPSINKITFPMISDKAGKLAFELGVMNKAEGTTIRGTFLIDPQGKIKLAEYNERGIGRDAEELLRKVRIAVRVAESGKDCPSVL